MRSSWGLSSSLGSDVPVVPDGSKPASDSGRRAGLSRRGRAPEARSRSLKHHVRVRPETDSALTGIGRVPSYDGRGRGAAIKGMARTARDAPSSRSRGPLEPSHVTLDEREAKTPLG